MRLSRSAIHHGPTIADTSVEYACLAAIFSAMPSFVPFVSAVLASKGNRYRLLTVVSYAAAVSRVADVLTHAQYSAWCNTRGGKTSEANSICF